MSSGCIRMLNADVVDLYQRVKVGAKVVVLPDNRGTRMASR
jgi:lipoprotein-anchoring transpeptidase ErfK/SrfK